MTNEINWTIYKAEVAKTMLPIMYRQAENNGRMVSSHAQQAVEAAVEIAELLERRLRGEETD
jgi:hypothetical protein